MRTFSWLALVLIAVSATTSLIGSAAERGVTAVLKDDAPRVAKPADDAKPADEKPLAPAEQDLKELQGRWSYEYANQAGVKMRVEKHVDGTNDTVTEYDAQGNIIHAHTSTFELKRHGPLKVFTIIQSIATAGPNMGMQRPGNRSYVYRVEGDRVIEAWGLLESDRGAPHIILWKKPAAAN